VPALKPICNGALAGQLGEPEVQGTMLFPVVMSWKAVGFDTARE
jgi:hypothetical protein